MSQVPRGSGGMSKVFRIMALVFLINIATGIMTQLTGLDVEGLTYDSTKGDEISASFNQSVAGAPTENADDFGEKILDFFSLGLFKKIKNFVNDYLLALPNLLLGINVITEGIATIINGLMGLLYVLGIFELFTGRRILG